MNIARAVTDGILMAAYFNSFTAVLALINPMYFYDSYPKSLQKVASRGKTPKEKKMKLVFGAAVLLPLVLYGAFSAWLSGTVSFWGIFASGYINWILVNFGDYFFLDMLLFQKCRDRLTLPGTEGHPDYELKNWLKALGNLEHLVEWPVIICPLFALMQTGLVKLLMLIL